MAIIVRSDLKLPKGKLASQCSHAAIVCYRNSEKYNSKMVQKWINEGQPKVVLKVENLEAMIILQEKASEIGIICDVIRDAGRTVVEPGTVTVMGLGPDDNTKIDEVISNLKLL